MTTFSLKKSNSYVIIIIGCDYMKFRILLLLILMITLTGCNNKKYMVTFYDDDGSLWM